MYKGKKLLFILTFIITIALAFTLFACTTGETEDGEQIATISFADKTIKDYYVIGEDINLADITISIVYKNGDHKTVAVSEQMLSESDRELFFVKGTYTVYINYEGSKLPMQITVINREDIVEYTARFFSNGGSEIESQKGTVIETFFAPQREGYRFAGWFTNYNLTGNIAKAPYKLNENMTFYAKWVDNRKCEVTFFDYYDEIVYNFEITYGSSININDMNSYPAPENIEGMVFSGWSVVGGKTEEITVDTEVVAIYISKDCIVKIYTDSEAVDSLIIKQLKYGDTFNVNNYVLPTKAGHVSRWVVYKNEETTYEELPPGGIIDVKYTNILIKPYNVINTYTITIENALPIQEIVNLKAGSIKTLPVYKDETLKQSYKVNYGSNFNISNFTETPYLVHPEQIEGYNAVWCIVAKTYTDDIWLNAYNQAWNNDTQKFEAAAGGSKSEYDLYDMKNDYVAKVKGNNANINLSVLVSLENIMGNITIMPKYIKKEYTVTLRRKTNNQWLELKTFSVPYLNDFKLYDKNLTEYNVKNFANSKEVERSYLYKNVASWLEDVECDVYYRSDSALEDDWTIEWFTSPDMTTNTKVNFGENSGTLGSIEIDSEVTLYCKDTDQRRYSVTLYYDYDFTKDPLAAPSVIYKKRVIYDNLTENEAIVLPLNYSNTITDTKLHDNHYYDISYTFKGWYDYIYNDPSGYTGNVNNPESTRNRNVYYYAHYECTTTFNLLIYDKTQKTAYVGRPNYDNNNYDVQEETMFYQLKAGTIFNSATMLYKGKVENGNITSGQRFQEKNEFVQWVNYIYLTNDTDQKDTYAGVVYDYGAGDYLSAVDELNRLINSYREELEACETLWGMLYTYAYGQLDKESYESTILTIAEYNNKQVEKKNCEDKLELIQARDASISQKNSYLQHPDDYKLYSESISHLNLAYDYFAIDIENDNVKYKFLGWFTDENYITPYTSHIDFEWFAAKTNLTLYAKWADQEKGTEGLVFQKMVIDGETVLAVVDIVDNARYLASIYNGCGYNDFDNKYYSVNLNDQGHVPVNIGTNLEIQIPKQHGGDNTGGYKVIGILKNAFYNYGKVLKSITMPSTLKFIEELAFLNCDIESFYISGCDYIDADDSRALYQTASYVVTSSEIDTVGALKSSGINSYAGTLIAYANKSLKDYLTLRSDTLKIASYALKKASKLKFIDFGQNLVSIGDNALESTGLIGHYDTATSTGIDTLIFPDSLVEIGNLAFKNSIGIKYISCSASSALSKVGFNALNSTNWYNAQIGTIIINKNFLGIRNGNINHYVKDEFDQIIYFGANSDEAKVISGNNNLYYKQVDGRFVFIRLEINDAINTISSGAFLNLSTLLEISFNNCSAMNDIYDEAFENCTNIGKLHLIQATNALKLGDNVFRNCPVLTLYVPDKNDLHASFANYVSLINLVDII